MTIGPKKKRLHVIAARTRHVYRLHDDGFAKSVAKNGEKISCTRGCAACCSQFVAMSYPEAVALYMKHGDMVDEMLPRLKEDSAVLHAIAEANGLDASQFMANETVRNTICRDWWRLKRPCAFLDPETRDCRVYETRPASCRTYHVSSDPSYCGTEHVSEVRIVCGDQDGFAHALEWAQGEETFLGAKRTVMGPMAAMLMLVRRQAK